MRVLNTVEFFSGTAPFSKECAARGHNTFTIDINKRFKPDLKKNILNVIPEDIPFDKIDIALFAPDCTTFSCASAWKHWHKNNTPKSWEAECSIDMIKKVWWLVENLNIKLFWIENPTGKLRKVNLLPPELLQQITYCQYGETRRKPTDIWTNSKLWKGRPVCEFGDKCHTTKTNDLNTPSQRAIHPQQFINEIIDISEQEIANFI